MKKSQSGIALLEALIAIVILGIGLLGAIGLQARAYTALAEADMRTEANMACERLLGIMTNDQGAAQANLPNYAKGRTGTPGASLRPWYDDLTTKRIPGAVVTVAVRSLTAGRVTQVDITIEWTRKTGDAPTTHSITSFIADS